MFLFDVLATLATLELLGLLPHTRPRRAYLPPGPSDN